MIVLVGYPRRMSPWRYPNIFLIFFSLLLTLFILYSGWLDQLFAPIKSWGYLGTFVIGVFFVSTFTVAPAAAALFVVSGELNPVLIGFSGALGATLGDYLAFRFIRERLMAEMNPFLKMLHLYRPVNVLHSRYFAWLAPVIGAVIIATPLPDEIGLSLLGMTKISIVRLVLLTFALHGTAIFLIALAAHR